MARHPHNVVPTGREVKFDGFIMSKTDLKGTITYVNRTFMQVADYPHPELIGKPHNIIRHPDMPRTAFYSLWQTIQNGEEWMGFVKNITRNGDHYWVFANVTTDFKDGSAIGYYSIRRPLPDAVIQIIEPIYDELRRIEQQHSGQAAVEAGMDHLQEVVKKAGFDSYRDFVLHTYLQHAPKA